MAFQSELRAAEALGGRRRRLRSCGWTLALFVGVTGSTLLAHNVVPEPTVDVFLRPLADRLTVTVWLPIAALADANLPRGADGHFVDDAIRPALDLVARGISRDLQLRQGDRPLTAMSVSTTPSPDESFVAIDLEYSIETGQTDLSGRFHAFRGSSQIIPTEVHYVADEHTTRTFRVDGEALRIALTPTSIDVFQHFFGQGADALFRSTDFLWFTLCLIAVARDIRANILAVVALVAGQSLALLLSTAGWLTLSPSTVTVVAAVAASIVVVIALQDFANPQSRWLSFLCFAFGLLSAGGMTSRLLHEWGFTGTHSVVGFTTFLFTVTLGETWVIALASSAAGILRRRGRVAELAVLSIAIFAAHAALHRMVDQAQMAADAGAIDLDRFLFALTVAWAVVIVCAGIAGTVLRVNPPAPELTGRRAIEAR